MIILSIFLLLININKNVLILRIISIFKGFIKYENYRR